MKRSLWMAFSTIAFLVTSAQAQRGGPKVYTSAGMGGVVVPRGRGIACLRSCRTCYRSPPWRCIEV